MSVTSSSSVSLLLPAFFLYIKVEMNCSPRLSVVLLLGLLMLKVCGVTSSTCICGALLPLDLLPVLFQGRAPVALQSFRGIPRHGRIGGYLAFCGLSLPSSHVVPFDAPVVGLFQYGIAFGLFLPVRLPRPLALQLP